MKGQRDNVNADDDVCNTLISSRAGGNIESFEMERFHRYQFIV